MNFYIFIDGRLQPVVEGVQALETDIKYSEKYLRKYIQLIISASKSYRDLP